MLLASLLRLALFSIFHISSIRVAQSFQSTRTPSHLCPIGVYPKSTTSFALAPLNATSLGSEKTTTEPKQSKQSIKWEKMFNLLCVYRDREGNANAPTAHKEGGENLGAWLSRQLFLYRNGKLDEYRCQKLESVGMVWEPSKSSSRLRWERMFDLLCAYREREGNANPPATHKEGGENLGIWLGNQRKFYRDGNLDEDRCRKLESICVVWEPRKSNSKPSWERMFDLLCTYCDREGNANVPQRHQEGGENLGTWLMSQRNLYRSEKLGEDRRQKLESIGVTWVESQWETAFASLSTYHQETGDCNVPRDYKVTNAAGKEISLGSWVDRQRKAKKGGSLDDCRIRKLEEIGFEWDRDTSRWNEMFSLLSDYKKREGHCNVPGMYKISTSVGSRNLGRWLGTQRQEKRKGVLDESRRTRLENLGVEWNVIADDWNKMLTLLEIYRKREGHSLVPAKHIEEGKALGVWLNNVRSKAKCGKLGPADSQALEDLGVVLDARAQKWEEMLALLVQYKKENGNCMVPQRHNVCGRNLGTWLNTQRKLIRDGSLLPSKKTKLEELGVVWDVHKWKWDQMLALLLEYKNREGDCMVPQRHEESGKNLGSWLDSQRQLQKKGALDKDKVTRLEAIGVIWDVPDFNQEEMMNSLLRYKEREGDCNVPTSHVEDGKSLGSWLNRQRRLRAAGKVDPSLINELEAAGVIWGINEQKWEDMFALLDRFQKREGHCRVPQNHLEGKDEKKLGTWLDYQRYKKKNGKLGATQQTRMEELGVEWNIYAKFDDGDDWGFEGMDHLFDDEEMYT